MLDSDARIRYYSAKNRQFLILTVKICTFLAAYIFKYEIFCTNLLLFHGKPAKIEINCQSIKFSYSLYFPFA